MSLSGNTLYYPDDSLVWDSVLLVFYALIETLRLGFAARGNKTESLEPLIKGTILGCVTVVAYIYFLRLQTWILYVEVILNSVGLAFVGFELLLSLNTMAQVYWDH